MKLSGRCKVINNLLRLSVLLYGFLVLLAASAHSAVEAPGLKTALDGAADSERINWQPWEKGTFELARDSGKLIFLDVGIEGCSACRRMERQTFQHVEVIRLLNERFVAIQVDAEAQPDVGQRYSDWAWPALVFLRGDGTQVLALRGNRQPAGFLELLNDLLQQQDAGELVADTYAPPDAPVGKLTSSLTAIRQQIRHQLDGPLNEQLGSWQTNGISATSAARLANLRFRAFMYANSELEAIVQHSQASFLKLLDPVWGGAYQAAYQLNTKRRVIPEKRLAEQAGALQVFAVAYQTTGEVRFRNALESVDEYLQEWLASEQGTFYTSQRNQPTNLPRHISAERYWSLRTEHERRSFGIPPVDHAIYTDKNAAIISGYVRAFEATGDSNYLRVAARTAQSLLNERLMPEGWIAQAGTSPRLETDERIRPVVVAVRPYLMTQARMGLALLDLYGSSGEPGWLQAARSLAQAMIGSLHDKTGGAFYATVASADEPFPAQKPLEANALAGRFLYNLSVYDKTPELAQLASTAVQVAATPGLVRREGKVTAEAGLMLELLGSGYVEISVVGDPDDLAARSLFTAALQPYHPRKLLHFEAPGRYPDSDQASVYICNPDFCTTPIVEPDQIAIALQDFVAPARTAYP
jgi:uncharacterized protein YyaL (SSP411 family)